MKTNVKKVLGIGLCVLVAAGIGIKIDYENFCKSGGFILEYHGVGYEPWGGAMVVSPKTFESHLQYLKDQGYTMVSVKELMEDIRKDKDVSKEIALSFDDGYKNNFQYALPIMKKFGAKGTFHVINNRIGKDEMYMNESEVKKMIAEGMEIGAHTSSHNPLGDIDPKYYDWELGVAKYDLERRFPGLVIETLAYPMGSFNDAIKVKLKQFGYKQALTGSLYLVDKKMAKENPFETARVFIEVDEKDSHNFSWLINRAYKKSYLRARGIDVGD